MAVLALTHAAPADQKEADSAPEAVAAAPQDNKDLETSSTYGLGYGLGYPGHGHLGYGLAPKAPIVAAPIGLGYGGLGYGGVGYAGYGGYGKCKY